MSHGLVENHRRSGDAASSGDELLTLLETRRSVAMTLLTDPGPSKDQLRRMLTIAARVPDHGALQPWRFIVIDGEARKQASERLAPIFAAENEAMEAAQREKFTGVISRVFTHAPLIVIVVSRTDPAARIPAGSRIFQQALSA
jgi:nitroreductase